MTDGTLYIGSRTQDSSKKEELILKYANRHGLIAGATGTGKTVTLQGLAEGFSDAGIPVFLADAKGDLTGMAEPSQMQDFLVKRAETIGMGDDYEGRAFPVTLWDVFGNEGLPIRTTISEMGPILLARILDLNDTQEGVLNIAFRLADDENMLMLDLKDLRAMMISMGQRAAELSVEYGNISKASIGAIQRCILQLEDQGGDQFFGEPALQLNDFIRHEENAANGAPRGMINILSANKLMQNPQLYTSFMLWLLSELFEELPEVGDAEKPKLIFFFDEAHLLFNNAPKSLLEKVEQVVKLIRSKGVGIYFVTQSPADIPESVLGQLGNRIQHALRSFTAKQRKDIKLAAQNYRINPEFDVETAITEIGVGEALVSTLEKKGQPSMVQRVLIRPPYSKLGPADKNFCDRLITKSNLYEKYADSVDRESAYEILKKKGEAAAKASQIAQEQAQKAKTVKSSQSGKKSNRQGIGEALLKSMVRRIGTQIGNQIIRGIMGALKR